MPTTRQSALLARAIATDLATAPDALRRAALLACADALEANAPAIFAANADDLARAAAEGLAMPLQKRLRFDQKKLHEVCDELRALCGLPDPLGRTLMATRLADGLDLYRVSCPIGVIGVIFESRPDALVQIAALCLRSGNAVLLKGGREALQTCRALFQAMDAAIRGAGLPEGWGALLETRADVAEMLGMDDCIDLLIPRGSNAFVRHIMDNSRIPVLGHADGVCHAYVDQAANLETAIPVVVDSKAQYPAVCNAIETLLVHQVIAPVALPRLNDALRAAGVTLRGCERTRAIIDCDTAEDADFGAEYLDLIIAVKVVDSLDAAIAHINRHGSGHTDVILTEDADAARAFLARVDSAGVYWNCSTRFADGYRYGLGAELGIATGKVHARGPMGLEGLCTYKYKLLGHGQTVGGGVEYLHAPIDTPCPMEE
ncbi:MAG: glutamate-5-semialdehyde dehydrogenase [Oscillospiraceae bacterium]|jgi:glutamate-5-semialdehyde dehydrogenase|nr:glutamate-5-semialdehyde dehydrogenase [Oscillospiraceae bacterium]